MYDGARAQMDGGAKCTVTNKIELLHEMKGATSENVIVLVAEGYLKVPTIQDEVFIKIKCYHSPEFTSTLLSDNDILEALPMKKDYCGQTMRKFFEPSEIDDLPEEQQQRLNAQELDEVMEKYDRNYENFILCCTHKQKFNRNVYIPGVIQNGLCYIMPLILRSDIPEDADGATVFTLQEKAYLEDRSFRKACNAKKCSLFVNIKSESTNS